MLLLVLWFFLIPRAEAQITVTPDAPAYCWFNTVTLSYIGVWGTGSNWFGLFLPPFSTDQSFDAWLVLPLPTITVEAEVFDALGLNPVTYTYDLHVAFPPSSPSLNEKSPDVNTVCEGVVVSSTFNPGNDGVECSDEYQFSVMIGGLWVGPFPYSEEDPIPTIGYEGVRIEGRRANCHPNSGCGDSGWDLLAQWIVDSDSQAPTVSSCPANITVPNNDPGACGAIVTYLEPEFEDNCVGTGLSGTMTEGQASGTLFPVGVTTVTYEYTDPAMNGTAVCTFTVTVNDTEDPTVTTCPSNINVDNDPGVCGATVNYTEPVFADNCDGPILAGTRTVGPASGSLFPEGITTVTYQYIDAAGNGPVECTFTVTVNDTEDPTVATCPGNMTVSNDLGLCEATVNYTEPVFADNCDGPVLAGTRTVGPASGSVFPLGPTTISYQYIDAAGNGPVECTFTVTVNDAEDPTVVSCQANIIVSNNPGICGATVNYTEPVFADNCDGPVLAGTRTVGPVSGSVFPVGLTTVTYQYTDAAGNGPVECTFTVTVNDVEDPTVVGCQANIIQANDPGVCGATINYTEPVFADNCDGPVLAGTRTVGPASGSVFPVGVTTVTYQYTDAAGNGPVECTFIVTVNDAEDPTVVSCQANITQANDPGVCGATVNYTEPVFADNCDGPVLAGTRTVGPASGSVFPLGVTTVTYQYFDAAGNGPVECTFTVTVNDAEDPTVVSCQANIIVSNDPGTCGASINYPEPVFADNCDGPVLAGTRTIGPASGSVFPVGIATVTYQYIDAAGNGPVECTFTVTVNDAEDPTVVSCQANIIVSNDPGVCGATVNYPEPVFADNCDGPVLAGTRTLGPASGSVFPVGMTTVTYQYTDAAGNGPVECSFTVTVNDTEDPTVISCQANITQDNDPGVCGATINYTEPVFADNCDGPVLAGTRILGPASGSVFPVGVTTVSYEYSDASGNGPVECTFTVTVNDTEDPTVVSCQANIIVSNDPGVCGATINYPEPVFADNCDGPVLAGTRTVGPASGSVFPVGITTVTYQYIDAAGNGPVECTFTVTVNDTEDPTLTSCQASITQVNDPGVCGATINYTEPVFADNCDGPVLAGTRTAGPASGSVFPIGVTTVIYEYSDAAGNGPVICNFTVTVTESEDPTVTTCPGNINVDNDPGICGATVNYTEPVFADNCDGPGLAGTMTAGLVSGSVFPLGITTVIYEYSDASGNGPAVCTFFVTVNDTEDPTVTTCPGNINVDNDPGVCGASVNYTEPVFADNCDGPVLAGTRTVGPASGSVFPVGVTTVTYQYIDAAGNGPVECTFTVTVNDTEDPTVTSCQASITQANDPGTCGASINYPEPVFADNCDGPVLAGTRTVGPASGSVFPVGITTVTYEYSDAAGNGPVECTFTVTVNDTELPTFTAPPDLTVNCEDDVTDLTLTGDVTDEADNCTLTLDAYYSDSEDVTDPCNVVITRMWILVDDASNTTILPQIITVRDLTPPTAVCQNITVQLDGTGNATITAADIDNGSGDNCWLDTLWLDVYDFSCADIGINTVSLTAEDACGLQSTCFATVTVEDNIVPGISCPGDVSLTAAAGECSILVNNIGPGSVTGNCSSQVTFSLEGATIGSGAADASGSVFNKGLTTIWYKIADLNGHADSCSFQLTVLTITVPPDNASSDQAEVCAGDGNIQLSYSGGVMPEGGIARWYDDVALTNVIGDGNGLTIPAPAATTSYYVRFEGDCDTTTAAFTTVTVKSLTVDPLSASVDRSQVCAGDGTIILSYNGGDLGSNGSAVWYEDPTLTSVVGSGNDLSLPAPLFTTSYYLRFEADCDTSAAVSVEVTVWPIPEPTFAEKYENACINGPLYRYVASGFASSTFTWSISGGTIVNNYNDTIYVDWGGQEITGSLELTESSVEGCISVPVSIQIEVGGPDLDLGADVGTCRGTSITISPEGQFASYLWHDGSTAPEYTTDEEGWVILEVTSNFGCGAKDSVYLTVYELPVVDLGPDTTICTEEGIILDAGPDGVLYNWSTGDIGQRITVYDNGNQEVWVEVENAYGCLGGDAVFIVACRDKYLIRPPSAITPNGDGMNDVWNIYDLQAFSQAEVEIYDQWGTLVWKSDRGYSQPWDGNTMEGRPVPVDSYHYVIHFNDGSDKEFVSYITVIR